MDISQLTLYSSIVTPLVLAGTLRMEMSIILPQEEEGGKRLTSLSILLGQLTAIGSVLVLGLILLLFSDSFQILKQLVLLVAFSVSFLTFKISLTFWFLRKGMYDKMSYLRIAESFFLGASPFLFFYVQDGLVIGTVVGHLLLAICYLFFFLKESKIREFRFSWKDHWDWLRQYKSFPLHNLPQAVIDVLQVSFLIYIVSGKYSADEVSYLYIAFRLLEVPIGLLIAPLSQLLMNNVREALVNGQSTWPILRSTLTRAAVLTVGVIPVFLFLGEDLIALAFGEKLRFAGQVCAILSIWYFTEYLKQSILQIGIFLNKQKQLLIFSIVRTTISVGILHWFSQTLNFHQLLGALSAIVAIGNLIQIFWLIQISRR